MPFFPQKHMKKANGLHCHWPDTSKSVRHICQIRGGDLGLVDDRNATTVVGFSSWEYRAGSRRFPGFYSPMAARGF